MDPLRSAPLDRLLAELGEPTSGVGAGVVACLSAAMAAGVLQAAARASAVEWDGALGAAAQAEALRERLLPLADENAEAYRRVRAALAGDLPEENQERRDFALGRLLERSALLPGRIAAVASDVAVLAGVVVEAGAATVRPDARAAGLLAAAAAEAAALLVAVNLAAGGDGPLVEEARAAASRARLATAHLGEAGGP